MKVFTVVELTLMDVIFLGRKTFFEEKTIVGNISSHPCYHVIFLILLALDAPNNARQFLDFVFFFKVQTIFLYQKHFSPCSKSSEISKKCISGGVDPNFRRGEEACTWRSEHRTHVLIGYTNLGKYFD